jgi:D-glycero-alpha-D-manno-heptose-7-phosphate kinase
LSVKTVDQVEHPIIREAMRLVGIDAPNLELTSMADIPAGTGLGLLETLPQHC